MFFPASGWIVAFVATVAIEVPIVVFLLRGAGLDRARVAGLVVFANLATHPIVWFVISQLFLVGTVAYVVAAELWAVAVEAVFYRIVVVDLSWGRAALVAVAANAASFALGRMIAALAPELFS